MFVKKCPVQRVIKKQLLPWKLQFLRDSLLCFLDTKLGTLQTCFRGIVFSQRKKKKKEKIKNEQ